MTKKHASLKQGFERATELLNEQGKTIREQREEIEGLKKEIKEWEEIRDCSVRQHRIAYDALKKLYLNDTDPIRKSFIEETIKELSPCP